MFKKLFFLGGGLFLLVALFSNSDVYSEFAGRARNFHDSIHEHDVDSQIRQARRLVRDLTPEIRENTGRIAKEEVEIDRLDRKIEKMDQELFNEKASILRLKEDLENGNALYYSGRTYTASEVKEDLESRFNRFKSKESTINNLKQALAHRRQNLESARTNLEDMLNARKNLSLEIDNLVARNEMTKVHQSTSEFSFNDNKLVEAKNLLETIATDIDINTRIANSDIQSHYEIPVEIAGEEHDILAEIGVHFDGNVIEEVDSESEIVVDLKN
ncbi:MAG: hypothetical protein MPJ24_10870 [Pirellulaceae bacterium]|nr:hypothetical protein [Pirellulaceae bacterium]